MMNGVAAMALSLGGSSLAYANLEAGVGVSVAHIPHYIGSDEASDYVVPFPYIRYRSEKLNIDRNLIQGNLWRRGNWSLELSFGGSVKVDSEDNTARQGMSDLDFIIEAGPALHYYFLGSRTEENAILLQLPLRVAMSTDFTNLSYQGLTSIPRIVWRRGYLLNGFEVRPQISAGVRIGNSGYHDYIFGVDPQFANAGRPQYEGKGGYGGFQAAYSTAVLWDNYLTAFGVRYVQLDGAAYENSPLVQRSSSLMAGLAVAYLF